MASSIDTNNLLFVLFRDYFWGWEVYVISLEGSLAHVFKTKGHGEWATVPIEHFADRKRLIRERPMEQDEIEHFTALFSQRKEAFALFNGA